MTGFEFTEQQNLVLLKLANAMRGFGLVTVTIGFALVFSGLSLGAGGGSSFLAALRGGQGIAVILAGLIWWISASGFYTIVNTQGSDISHLMNTIRFLSTAFMFILVAASIRVFLQGVVAANSILTMSF